VADVAPIRQPPLRDRGSAGDVPGLSAYARRVAIAVAIVFAAALGVLAIYAGRSALLVIYISVLIATGLMPIVRHFERALGRTVGRPPRWIAATIVYAGFLAGLIAIGLLIVPTVVDQADELRRRVPSLLSSWQSGLVRHGWITRPLTIADAVHQSSPETSRADQPIALAASAARRIATGLFETVTVLILAFYILIDGPRVGHGLARAVPSPHRARVTAVARDVTGRVSAWLQGNLLISGIMGSATAVAMFFLGEPYFWVVATVAALAEAVPLAGPILAGIFAVLLAATVSPELAFSVAIVFVVLHEVEANILVPKIMERQVGLSSLAVFIALLVGAEWFSIVGAILAIPTAAIAAAIVEELRKPAAEHAIIAADAAAEVYPSTYPRS